jgi:MoxR-like ATPase
LVLAGKARALLEGRTHVTLEDVRHLALPVLRHRLVPTFGAQAEGIEPDDLIAKALAEIPVPKAKAL